MKKQKFNTKLSLMSFLCSVIMMLFGSEKWDVPLSLKEMYSGVDSVILTYAPDYTVRKERSGEYKFGDSIDEGREQD